MVWWLDNEKWGTEFETISGPKLHTSSRGHFSHQKSIPSPGDIQMEPKNSGGNVQGARPQSYIEGTKKLLCVTMEQWLKECDQIRIYTGQGMSQCLLPWSWNNCLLTEAGSFNQQIPTAKQQRGSLSPMEITGFIRDTQNHCEQDPKHKQQRRSPNPSRGYELPTT